MAELPFKLHVIRARVSKKMKEDLQKMAVRRGEAEAVLVREALKEYIRKRRGDIVKRHAKDTDPKGNVSALKPAGELC